MKAGVYLHGNHVKVRFCFHGNHVHNYELGKVLFSWESYELGKVLFAWESYEGQVLCVCFTWP